MQTRRDAAFLFPFDLIAGEPVHPLSIRLWLVLTAMRSPFLTGDFNLQHEDIGAAIRRFLWVVSHEFSLDPKARDRFLKRIDRLDAADAINDIRDYLDRAFADSPYSNHGRASVPHSSMAAEVVDHFAREYGWQPDTILNLPLSQLWQLRNCIAARTQKQPVFANREVDQAAKDWLRQQRQTATRN